MAHRGYHPTYNSPYAAPRPRPARWPWAFATIILIAIITMSGLLVGDQLDNGSGSALSRLTSQATITPEGSAEGVAAGSPEPTVTPEPTATFTPVPSPTAVDTQAPRRAVENWVALWQTGDYAGMYDLISAEARQGITEEAFVARYTDIETEAGLTGIAATLTGAPGLDGQAPIEVTYQSSLVGEITQSNTVQLVKEEEQWRVAWTPSLIFSQLSDTGCADFVSEPMRRGRILDRNGEVLAEDAEVARIGIVPGRVENPDETFRQLSQIIDLPADQIAQRVEGQEPEWLVPIKDMPGGESAELLNQLAPFDGVQVRRAFARSYPQGELTAHVTGWVSLATQEDVEADETGTVQADSMIGRSGLEAGANELLSGKPGGRLLVVECETRAEREVIAESEGTPAKDVYTTIDLALQREVDKALGEIEDTERGAAVVIDPRTGAILAMVSHPTFDPNGFVTGQFSEDEQRQLNDDLLRPLANRATAERYPTGSIFKVITTAAAMEYLGYTGDTEINCPSTFSIGNQEWDDWVMENGLPAQGMLTLHSGLVRSCNSVFYQIGADLDQEDPSYLPEMTRAFGLGAEPGVPYFYDVAGTVPDPQWKQEVVGDGWSTGDAVNLSIGQGYLLATPLQMANAYATIANGGTLLQPYIVDRTSVPDSGSTEQVGERIELGELPLNDEQIAELQSALRDQTNNEAGVGSDKVFGDFDWPISGKTGTAENSLDGSGKPHSWFAAYGPADDEATIASVVMVENIGEGVTYAAPVTRQIYEYYINTDLAQQTAP